MKGDQLAVNFVEKERSRVAALFLKLSHVAKSYIAKIRSSAIARLVGSGVSPTEAERLVDYEINSRWFISKTVPQPEDWGLKEGSVLKEKLGPCPKGWRWSPTQECCVENPTEDKEMRTAPNRISTMLKKASVPCWSCIEGAREALSGEPFKRAEERIKAVCDRGQDPIAWTRRRLKKTEDPGKIQGIYLAATRRSKGKGGLAKQWAVLAKEAKAKYQEAVGEPITKVANTISDLLRAQG